MLKASEERLLYSGLTWNTAVCRVRAGVAQFAAPVAGGVVGPAAAIGLGQRMRAETGVDEAGQQRHAAKIVAHWHKANLGGQVFGKQGALVAELGQAGVVAAGVFLDWQAVAYEVFGGAVTATIIDGDLHQASIGATQYFAQVELGTDTHLLRVAGAVLDPAMQVGEGFGVVITGQLDALVDQLLALAAPVAGQGRTVHQVVGGVGQYAGRRQGQQ